MNKKIITLLMATTTLTGSLFATDAAPHVSDNSTQMPFMLQLSMNMGSLMRGEEALSEKIDDYQQAIKSQLSSYQSQSDQRFEKIDLRFEKIDQRFEKIDQRFEKIDQQLDTLRQETREQFSHLGRKIDSFIFLFNATQQQNEQKFLEGYINLTKIAEQSHANLTIAIEKLETNSTKVQTAHEERIQKLETHWSQHFYASVLENPQFYVGLLSLAFAAKSTTTLPASTQPYVPWVFYGVAGICLYQVFWNLLAPSTPPAYQATVAGGILMTIAATTFTVQKNEAHIGPYVTLGTFLGFLTTATAISNGWKAVWNFLQNWTK